MRVAVGSYLKWVVSNLLRRVSVSNLVLLGFMPVESYLKWIVIEQFCSGLCRCSVKPGNEVVHLLGNHLTPERNDQMFINQGLLEQIFILLKRFRPILLFCFKSSQGKLDPTTFPQTTTAAYIENRFAI